ncbi:MAG: sigma-54-dependent transcriptional regulator [Calditrichia bacterium]
MISETVTVHSASVLLVDDEPTILKTVCICLEDMGLKVTKTTNPSEAVELAGAKRFDIAFVDLKMKPLNGLQVLQKLSDISPNTLVVIITAHGDISSAIAAIKQGAHDYLQKPFDFDELQAFTSSLLEYHRFQQDSSDESMDTSEGFPGFITCNAPTEQTLRLARRVAKTDLSVLIEGESGTGKEVIAQLIHKQSSRAEQPFVAVNCAALSESLLESELFGHTKGSFTGAIKDRVGRFESANKGTIFLDEIGELSPALQAKLLRVLQESEIERVGSNKTIKIDVRILSATHVHLESAIAEKRFREDLFYRLNTVRLSLPPLRERREDIPLLIRHFLKNETSRPNFSQEALQLLCKHSWPGNVRELENIVMRLSALHPNSKIRAADIPADLHIINSDAGRLLSLEETEKLHIKNVLSSASDLADAARILGIDPATLWRKRKKYNL